MALYPKEVQVSEAQIAKLTDLYKKAYADIVKELTGATNFGTANRRAILAQVERILRNLGLDVDAYIREALPDYYYSGARDAVKQLNNTGVNMGVSTGFNRIHEEAIAALVDDASKGFMDSLAGMNRNVRVILGKAVRDSATYRLGKGIIGGEATRTIKRDLVTLLEEQGIDSFKDKAGRSWTLDRYTETLIRTKAVEARNRGLVNRMAENGYDLVQVSNHNSDHPECAIWEGKILSITGATKTFNGEDVPTLAFAESAGLFHPNCKHAINAIVPSLARETQAYDQDTGQYGAPGESLTRTRV